MGIFRKLLCQQVNEWFKQPSIYINSGFHPLHMPSSKIEQKKMLKDDGWGWTMDVDQYQTTHRSQSGDQKICRQTDGQMQDKKLLGTQVQYN